MKKATQNKLRDIVNRVKDLKQSYPLPLKAPAGSESRLVPRVAGAVVEEGLWLVRLARALSEKYADRVEVSKAEADALAAAELFFEEAKENFDDEVGRNGFLFRLDADFITHLEAIAVLVRKLDAQVQASVTTVEELEEVS